MKNLTKIAGIAIVLSLTACGGNETSTEVASEEVEVLQENVVVADYKIEGMVCAMGCAKTIEDEVASINGVTVSDVDYDLGKAHFEFDKTQTSEADIKAKIATIADGQYKVGEWVEEEVVESEETETLDESSEESETLSDKVEVSFSNFEVPNLFTLLVKSL
ncbi:MAG: heavy-metal-associated domain-containing protein [Flavobacteriales bacterium]|nr:heavy-metal-associated domain-containing protein [Flavobacteriales bacterium]MCB9365129.1 heavy-metal-associated domain-containing protein [Flavobacteriales bacterium]